MESSLSLCSFAIDVPPDKTNTTNYVAIVLRICLIINLLRLKKIGKLAIVCMFCKIKNNRINTKGGV